MQFISPHAISEQVHCNVHGLYDVFRVTNNMSIDIYTLN